MYSICTVSSRALGDFSVGMRDAILELGMDAGYVPRTVAQDAVNIFLDAALIQDWSVVPANSIIFNLEQLGSTSNLVTSDYIAKLKSYQIWDYSLRNIDFLKKNGVQNSHYAPIGYSKTLARPTLQVPKDIDVLFYGYLNDRRQHVLDQIKPFAKVVATQGTYGDELFELIARAKIVLNLHFYSTHIFEAVRVSYLLANKTAVLSEVNVDTDIPAHYHGSICSAPYELLPEACMRLLQNEPQRRYLEEMGNKIFSRFPMSGFLPIR